MIHNKTFVTWNGTNVSSRIFNVEEGLQHGVISSPTFFIIFTLALLKLFNLNQGKRVAIVFADDVIVCVTGKKT